MTANYLQVNGSTDAFARQTLNLKIKHTRLDSHGKEVQKFQPLQRWIVCPKLVVSTGVSVAEKAGLYLKQFMPRAGTSIAPGPVLPLHQSLHLPLGWPDSRESCQSSRTEPLFGEARFGMLKVCESLGEDTSRVSSRWQISFLQ